MTMWAKLREYLSARPMQFAQMSALLSGLSQEARMEAASYIHAHEPTWPGAWSDGAYAGDMREVAGLPEARVVWCPAGSFLMGSPDGGDRETWGDESLDNEKPQHEVTLTRGFWMWQTPITQAQHEAVMGYKSSSHPGDLQRPVDWISWYEAMAYCNALSEQMGLQAAYRFKEVQGKPGDRWFSCESVEWAKEANGWRLPTEAEWEYAARAGTTTSRYGKLDQIAWYEHNDRKRMHAVGQKQANAWGLHDMIGTVWEWCYDQYSDYTASPSPSIDPCGPASDPARNTSGFWRVFRGGVYKARFLRAAARDGWLPIGSHNHRIGMRAVRSDGTHLDHH